MSAPVAIRNAFAACLVFASPALWAGSLPVPVDAKVVDQRPAVEQERVYPMGPLRKISGRLRVEDKVESRARSARSPMNCRWNVPPAKPSPALAKHCSATAATRCSGAVAAIAARPACGPMMCSAMPASTAATSSRRSSCCAARRSRPTPGRAVQRHRGNRRAYLHVEEFVAGSPLGELLPTAATVLREMRDTGKLDYPDWPRRKTLGEPAGPQPEPRQHPACQPQWRQAEAARSAGQGGGTQWPHGSR